jgi:16S rRNA (adenine1518-N6/adenine1519-N6)-dimethyltransferase
LPNKRPKTKDKIPITKFAKKSLGQNFLVDRNYIDKIIAALRLGPGQTVVEIGPGRGALTRHLVESGAEVIAVELDRDLIPVLQKEFKDDENLRIIQEDALQVDFSDIINPKSKIQNSKSVKLVANLPYYISTAILQRLIEQRAVFSEFVLMLQREVVDRITAAPENSERGFLTVLVEAFCETEKLFDVPPTAFRPAPKVWSAVARLRPKESAVIENDAFLRDLLSLGFAQKRKTILNNLKGKYPAAREVLENSGIEPNRRAETLTLDEWRRLVSAFQTG